MRLVLLPLIGALMATPVMAQGYYPYGNERFEQNRPDGWSTARDEWQRARHAREIARWRAANGDYEGANRAEYWAERHRERAHEESNMARERW